MSAPAEIIEKIRKLLRLARSSNPHEAALALARALELAAEHRIAVDALNPDESAQEAITHFETEVQARVSLEKKLASCIVKNFFRVSPISVQVIRMVNGWHKIGYKLTLVGTASDLEIARYVFGFLWRHFAFCWTHRTNRRLQNRSAFIHGMFDGLSKKLLDQMPPATPETKKGTGLVLSRHGAYIGAVIGKTKQGEVGGENSDAKAARWAGIQAGQKTEIRGGLKPAEPAPLVLT